MHAGLLPAMDARDRADAVARSRGDARERPGAASSSRALYGDEPRRWRDDLAGYDRLRVAVNACTRLRFCTADGTMELKRKARTARHAPEGFRPWFEHENRASARHRRSSAATGRRSSSCSAPNVLMLDSGCLWGGTLTALRLDGSPRVSGSGPRRRCCQNRSDSVFRRARELAPLARARRQRGSEMQFGDEPALAGHRPERRREARVADVSRRDALHARRCRDSGSRSAARGLRRRRSAAAASP